MKLTNKNLIGLIVLLFFLTSCNVPVEQVPPPDDVQTAAALTVQAAIAVASSTVTPSAATVAPASQTASATGSPAVTVTITPTYSVPTLTVRESTNCRTGPGEDYEIVFTYLSGKKLEIAGRYDPGNFWLVKSSESPTGTCWLWGQYVDVTGSYWAVASVTPPPTSTNAPPRAPSIQNWEYVCDAGILNFTVTWTDNANSEDGYRVFRNGEEVIDLPANSSKYTDSFDVSDDLTQSVEYYLQVHGPGGSVNSSAMKMKCQ